jgi:hypothetical protein
MADVARVILSPRRGPVIARIARIIERQDECQTEITQRREGDVRLCLQVYPGKERIWGVWTARWTGEAWTIVDLVSDPKTGPVPRALEEECERIGFGPLPASERFTWSAKARAFVRTFSETGIYYG